MAKIIKRKSDNLVILVLDDDNVVNLTSDSCTWNDGNKFSQDINSSTHEIVTGVTAPTKFFSGYFTYDTDWSLDTSSLNNYNIMADEVGLPRIEAEL